MIEVACHKEGLFIQANGDVYPCCGTWWNKKLKIGNILDELIVEKIEQFSGECMCDRYKLIANNLCLSHYKEINIETSHICQADCAMCCIDAPNTKMVYDAKNYDAILKLLLLAKPQNILLQGGEILVQNETMRWIEKIKSYLPNSKLTLITNGNNTAMLDYVKNVFDNVQVSIVGFQRHTYRTIMGLDFDKTEVFCRELSDTSSVNLYLKYLITPLGIHELPLFIRWAFDINPSGVIIHESGTGQYIKYDTFDSYWEKILTRTKKDIVNVIKDGELNMQSRKFNKIHLGGYDVARFLKIDNAFLVANKIDNIFSISQINYHFADTFEMVDDAH